MRSTLRRILTLAMATTVVATACGSGSSETVDIPPTTESTTTTPVPEVPAVNVRLDEVARLDRPTALTYRNGSDDVFITEQSGRVRRIAGGPNGSYRLDPRPVVDISNAVSVTPEPVAALA